jgi:hypothetical protein
MNRTVSIIFLSFALSASVFAQTTINAPALRTPPPNPPTAIQSSTIPAPISALPSAPVPAAPQPPALVFDAESKEYNAKPGEVSAPFVFNLTNVSAHEVIITNVTTSCGCTVAQLPSQPWHLAPGANGEIKATMNLVGKMGHVTKQLTVNSSVGTKALLVNVNVPPPQPISSENLRGDRNKNMELAKTDRQAVFKGDCRSCHVDKGSAKLGKELYAADCGICHDSSIRAAMVPDLRAPKGPRDENYWVTWITHGRPGSMMPAFSEKEGGPLSAEQINSLAKYLMENFPRGAAPVLTPVIAPAPSAGPKAGAGQ